MNVIFICESLDSSSGGPAKSIPEICQNLRDKLESLTLLMIRDDDNHDINNEY